MGLIGFEHENAEEVGHHIPMGNSTWAPLHHHDPNGEDMIDLGPGPYVGQWITSPVLELYHINYNLLKDEAIGWYVRKCLEEEIVIFGGLEAAPAGNISSLNEQTAFFSTILSFDKGQQVSYFGDPMAQLFLPVYDGFGEHRKAVAVTTATINWRHYFTNVLPETMQGITVVLSNECDGSFTYEVHGHDARAMGFGSLHSTAFESYDNVGSFDTSYIIKDGTKHGLTFRGDSCPYRLHVYPSQVRCTKQYQIATGISFLTMFYFFVLIGIL
jgi:hypothetical protein